MEVQQQPPPPPPPPPPPQQQPQQAAEKAAEEAVEAKEEEAEAEAEEEEEEEDHVLAAEAYAAALTSYNVLEWELGKLQGVSSGELDEAAAERLEGALLTPGRYAHRQGAMDGDARGVTHVDARSVVHGVAWGVALPLCVA